MLKSMTAFARVEQESEQGALTWELKTVNHRYLESNIKLPDNVKEIEPAMRQLMRRYLSRGKLDCSLKWIPSSQQQGSFSVDQNAVEKLNQAISTVSSLMDNVGAATVLDVLKWPGVINTEVGDRQALCHDAISSFEEALKILQENRMREGKQLEPLFEQRLVEIDTITRDVRAYLPEILKKQNELILKRFEAASIEIDKERLAQEMVLLAQKTDVAEELDRLDAHVIEVRQVLKKKEPVGRRLDFLMQELNREANTLSSKSIVSDTTKAAVELKVLIEQMREQVQNVE